MDYLWNNIFGFVTKSVNDYAAANGTIGTSTTCLCGPGDLQSLSLGHYWSEVESEDRDSSTSENCSLDKCSSRDFHGLPPFEHTAIETVKGKNVAVSEGMAAE